MEPSPGDAPSFTHASKRFVRRLLAAGENRVELLMVEIQEERQRLLRSLLLALGAAAFGLLAGAALTAAIVVVFWDTHPILALLVVTVLYGGMAAFLCARLNSLQRNWRALPATLDQLRKDRTCLEKILLL